MKKIVWSLFVILTWATAMNFDFSAGRVKIKAKEPTITLNLSGLDKRLKQKDLKKHDSQNKKDLFIFPWRHYESITDVNLINNKTIGVSRSKDGAVKFWDIETGTIIESFKNLATRQYDFSESSQIMAAVYGDYQTPNLILYDWNTSKFLKRKKLTSKVDHLSLSYDGSLLAYTQEEKDNDILYIYDVKNDSIIYSHRLNGKVSVWTRDGVNRYGIVKFSEFNHLLAFYAYRGDHYGKPFTQLINAKNGKVIHVFNGKIRTLEFNPTRNIFAILTRKELTLYDIKTNQTVYTFPYEGKHFYFSFSDDGRYVIINFEKNYFILDLNTKKLKEIKSNCRFYSEKFFIDVDSDLMVRSCEEKINVYQFNNQALLKTYAVPNMYEPERIYKPGHILLMDNFSGGYVNAFGFGTLNLTKYHKKLAKKIYNSIDKSDYIALYEFTKKFYNKFDVVQKAYRDIYKAVTKEDTLESYEWYVSVFEKTIYNDIAIKDHIDGYYWYQTHFDDKSAKELETVKKKLNTLRQAKYAKEYEAVKKENNLAIYEYYAASHVEPKAGNLQDAVNAMHKLAFQKAKEINTVSAYNTFIFAYPYADEVEEANRLAYELEKKTYTDIGLLGFFGKDEKMNKQARKLLIKAKKILEETVPNPEMANYKDMGVYMVVDRMYRLAQEEFADTDAVLTLMESDKLKKFKKRMESKLRSRKYGNQSLASHYPKDHMELRSEAVYYIFTEAPNIDKAMKQFYKDEKKKAQVFIKKANEVAQKVANEKRNKIKEKQKAFEKLYEKEVSEYKPEPVKVESLDLDSLNTNESAPPKNEIEQDNSNVSPPKVQTSTNTHLSNTMLDIFVDYKEEGELVRFTVQATNKGMDAAGGVTLSFPNIKNKNVVENIVNEGFGSVDVYGTGSRIWHGGKKQVVDADYLLVEGWNKVWKSGETKTMRFSIDKSLLHGKSLNVRAVIKKNRQEYILPKNGDVDQQGYPVKRVGIDLPIINNTSIYQKEKSLKNIKITNYSHPEDEPKGLYIVDLQIGGRLKTYRLYCPKKMVRDITNNTYGKSRSIEDEDSIVFSGKSVLRKAYQKICFTAGSHHQAYQTQQTVIPVIVNRTDVGTVRGISRNGDGFVAVRGGPGTGYAMIDKLYSNGEKVTIAATKGKWKGIVYGHANCKQGLSKQRGEPYAGSCKKGWVYGKYIQSEKQKRVDRKRKKIKGITTIGSLMYQNKPRTRLYTWYEAKRYCRNLTWKGYRGWRLPTTKELEKLFTKRKVQGKNGQYYIRKEFVDNLSGMALFWTSTKSEYDSKAEGINFEKKAYYWLNTSFQEEVLCVRYK